MKHGNNTFAPGRPTPDGRRHMASPFNGLDIASDRYTLWENSLMPFVRKLHAAHAALTRSDITVLLLIRLDFPNEQIARMLHILPSSFRLRRWRLKRKLGLPGADLRDIVMRL